MQKLRPGALHAGVAGTYPHRIRLRGPWDFVTLPADPASVAQAKQGRASLPCTLSEAGLAGYSGPVRFTRRFGSPRTLDHLEHVWLVFHARAISTQIKLNDIKLAEFQGAGEFAVEATGLLGERNLLEVSLHAADDRDGLTGETWLEIRRAAYLRGATVKRLADSRIQAAFELAGKVEAGLELYLLASGRTLVYWRATEAVEQAVSLISEETVAAEIAEARLELVQGGVVWYGLDIPIQQNDMK